ncbi:hypothetical protein OAF63_03310 [Saprospiraceae bacterium]|jgi:hypothetical protein|nr:hypothetical protein [Bacteroidota bacterium]MDB4727796.1 hypothetical protein [Saprospiraceae bacterium]MDF1867469.1 hypothetical protein [Saprospiraceae bacterium]
MKRKVLVIGAFLFFSVAAFSQIAATSNDGDFVNTTEELTEMTNENWSFFMDEENQVYYIDFETISVNLNDIVVKNQDGDIVIKEDVWELPVNTIFELDFSTFKPGEYDVELRSLTGVLKKTVSVK